MTTRYLATIEGVFCAVPLRDQLSNLITHTQYLADRNIYAAVLTRQQWDKLREEFWATGRQCDHGRLVPDIDFIASDGKSFLDFEACQKHEEKLFSSGWEIALRAKLVQSKGIRLHDLSGKYTPFGQLEIFLASPMGLHDDIAKLIESFDTIIGFEFWNFGASLFILGLHEDFEPMQVPSIEEITTTNAIPEYCLVDGKITKSQVGEAANSPDSYSGTVGSSPTPATITGMVPMDTIEKVEAEEARVTSQLKHLEQFEIKTAPDGPAVEIVAEKAPDSLEDRMLVVVGSNYMALTLVASLLKTEVDSVRSIAVNSDKFSLSGTGKSICKTT